MRYNSINNYGKKFIMEQDATDDVSDIPMVEPEAGDEETPEGDGPVGIGDAPIEGDAPISDTPEEPTMDGEDVEEIDITDLVNMTKNIKNDLDSQKGNTDEITGKMGDLFGRLDDLAGKLSQMDTVINKIDMLGAKVETMKEPTPQEKLEMRSLDSYPFSQNPNEFFSQKKLEMDRSGKNEYIIKKSDISDYSDGEMRGSFNDLGQEDEYSY